jgi:CBS domain-containing membrane protein
MSTDSSPSESSLPSEQAADTSAANEAKAASEAKAAGAVSPSGAEGEERSAAEATSNAAEPAASPTLTDEAPNSDGERMSAEVVEVDPESIHPPPPPRSLRPKEAKDLKSPPIGVTAQLPAPAWPPKTIADLMTRKIITVGESEPIGNLEALMEKFRFRHLPVVEAGMKLVGLISRTDLLHAELGRKPDGTTAPKVDGDTLAGAIMNKNVVFAQLDTPVITACRVMIDKKLTCIPVVLADHTLVGIVTGSDFLRLSLDLLKTNG